MKQLMVIVCAAMVLMGCGKKHESPTSGSFGHEANEKYNDDLNKADAQKQAGAQPSNAPASTNQSK
jgi:hypothetical protein